MTATLAVTPGASYQIRVGVYGNATSIPAGYNGGGAGGSGNNGTGRNGGGASDVRGGAFGLADRLLVAGGGGGTQTAGGAGGTGDANGSAGSLGQGGAAGRLTGLAPMAVAVVVTTAAAVALQLERVRVAVAVAAVATPPRQPPMSASKLVCAAGMVRLSSTIR